MTAVPVTFSTAEQRIVERFDDRRDASFRLTPDASCPQKSIRFRYPAGRRVGPIVKTMLDAIEAAHAASLEYDRARFAFRRSSPGQVDHEALERAATAALIAHIDRTGETSQVLAEIFNRFVIDTEGYGVSRLAAVDLREILGEADVLGMAVEFTARVCEWSRGVNPE